MQAQQLNEEQHAYQAKNNGRDAGQRFNGKTDDANQALVRGVFVQVNRGAHAQGDHNDHCHQHNVERVQDVRQNANGVTHVACLRGKQLGGDTRNAAVENVADDRGQNHAHRNAASVHQTTQQNVFCVTRRGNSVFRLVKCDSFIARVFRGSKLGRLRCLRYLRAGVVHAVCGFLQWRGGHNAFARACCCLLEFLLH